MAGALARLAAEVAKDHSSGGLLITVDELQVAAHPDLALLAATLHRLNVDHSGAVSYTHLDVYKRQTLISPLMPWIMKS